MTQTCARIQIQPFQKRGNCENLLSFWCRQDISANHVHAKQHSTAAGPTLSSQVNGSAVLLMCLVERRYRRIFSRRAHRLSKDTGSPSPPGQYSPSSVASGCPSPQQVAIGLARGAGAALRRRLERAAATASSAAANGTGLCITAADCAQPLPGGLPVGGSSAVEANAAACAAEAEAGPQLDPGSAGGPEPQHGEAQLAAALLVQGGARGACGGIPAPVSGMSGAAGGGSVDASYELGLGVARKPHGRQLSTQVDAVTQARLQHLRQCLNRVRPKYVTHFRHHQVRAMRGRRLGRGACLDTPVCDHVCVFCVCQVCTSALPAQRNRVQAAGRRAEDGGEMGGSGITV